VRTGYCCDVSVEQHDSKAAECESTLVKINKAIADLQREEVAIRDQMLKP
jgi:hypothetical protein